MVLGYWRRWLVFSCVVNRDDKYFITIKIMEIIGFKLNLDDII